MSLVFLASFRLSWLLFAEPFLLLYAIMKSSPFVMNKLLQKLALIIPVAQIPFSIYQALHIGIGDSVQGTFAGQGAGHHVMGAISLLGVLYVLSKKIEKFKRGNSLEGVGFIPDVEERIFSLNANSISSSFEFSKVLKRKDIFRLKKRFYFYGTKEL